MHTGIRLISTLLTVALITLSSACDSYRISFRKSEARQDMCWNKIHNLNANSDTLNQLLDREISQYQLTVEQLLVNREKTLRLFNQIDKEKAISPADLDALNRRLKAAVQTIDTLVNIIDRNHCWRKADKNYMQAAKLPPLDSSLRVKGSMLTLSSALMLYDSYLTIVALASEDTRIRRFLNQSDIGYGKNEDQMAAMTDDFLSIANLSSIEQAIAYYEKNRATIQLDTITDDNLAYLDLLIQSSSSYPLLRDLPVENIIGRRMNARNNTIQDSLNALNRTAVNGISELFGNTVGLVEQRKGKLYQDKTAEQLILSKLQPGDILLEKTPFRLTDKMIPGYWGHAAIWLGNQQELIELGLWNTPIIQDYQQQIQNQQLLVEALRDGTKMNTLNHFLNIDDLVILRQKNITRQDKKQIIELTLRQIGKPYDFNYDVETTDKIVCSQLVYLAYTHIEWPTDNIAGRYTISPDNIALKALKDGELEIILLYIDGKLYTEDKYEFMHQITRK